MFYRRADERVIFTDCYGTTGLYKKANQTIDFIDMTETWIRYGRVMKRKLPKKLTMCHLTV